MSPERQKRLLEGKPTGRGVDGVYANRTKLTLPNKDEISYLYYGSGHLSAIKYNDKLITEISRDRLHREITRTQGRLTTQLKRDPLGRLAKQLAGLNEASEATSSQIVERLYQYDEV
ncbi:hypothetical protein ACWIUA_12535, partial [Ursidibacter sp. B-7004-1]